jgi:hypothetical protein
MYVVSFKSCFNENATILASRLQIPFITELSPNRDDIMIVFGAFEQADKLVFIQNNIGCSYIIIQSEKFDSKAFDNKYYIELLENNPILDWSRLNTEKIKSRINTRVFSFYFYDFLSNIELPHFESRPIDFFFTGESHKLRDGMLEEFKRLNPNSTFEFDISNSYTNPAELFEKLKNVKYVLLLPYDNSMPDSHTIHRALSVGCEVISVSMDESLSNKYRSYVHTVSRLTDFTTLLEIEKRGDYEKFMKEYGLIEIENNLRAIVFAHKTILDSKNPKTEAPKVESSKVDFADFLEKKLKTENKFLNEQNDDSSVQVFI